MTEEHHKMELGRVTMQGMQWSMNHFPLKFTKRLRMYIELVLEAHQLYNQGVLVPFYAAEGLGRNIILQVVNNNTEFKNGPFGNFTSVWEIPEYIHENSNLNFSPFLEIQTLHRKYAEWVTELTLVFLTEEEYEKYREELAKQEGRK